MDHEHHLSTIKTTATISLLAGVWLFVSPWVYQSYAMSNAWNNWIVAALIVIFSAIWLGAPAGARGFSVANFLLGAWMFASPWIYGYTSNTSHFINSLCVGVLVFALGIYGSSVSVGHTTSTPPAVRP